MLKKWLAVVAVFTSLFALSGCGYNTMQSQDEAANAACEPFDFVLSPVSPMPANAVLASEAIAVVK